MNQNNNRSLFIGTIIEILVVIKKMGVPFVILGIVFLIYSKIEGRPVIPFERFILLYLSMVLFQSSLENVWLEREIQRIKEEVKIIKNKKK